jgi:hypothetical protein
MLSLVRDQIQMTRRRIEIAAIVQQWRAVSRNRIPCSNAGFGPGTTLLRP